MTKAAEELDRLQRESEIEDKAAARSFGAIAEMTLTCKTDIPAGEDAVLDDVARVRGDGIMQALGLDGLRGA